MNQALMKLEIDAMSVEERLELIGWIWDSLPDADAEAGLPESHRVELERRRASAESDTEAGIPWEVAKGRIRSAL